MDFTPLPLAFSLRLTVASRFLHPYSTDDKTFRIWVKQIFTARKTQRDSQSYREEKREKGDICDQEEKRVSQKEIKQSSQQSVP